MKKSIAIIVLFILLLSVAAGCENSKVVDISSDETGVFEGFSNTEYNSEADYQYFFCDSTQVQLVGNGYFLRYGDKLYYLSKDTMQLMPVCSQINCEHNTKDCDAYVNSVSVLRYYDGYLYYVDRTGAISENVNTLCRKSLDGSQTEKICDLIAENNVCVTVLGIHRGYVFYNVREGEDKCVLYRVDLDKKKLEKVYSYKAVFADLYRFIGYGDGVLFGRSCALNKDYSAFKYDLCYYDYKKNKVYVVLENSGGDYAVADGIIYYYADGGVYSYDVETDTKELFYAIDEPVYLSYDGKYLYLDNGWAEFFGFIEKSEIQVYIVDMEGNLIDAVSANEYYSTYGDMDYMFQTTLTGIEFFDKSKIGTNDKEWTKIDIDSAYN